MTDSVIDRLKQVIDAKTGMTINGFGLAAGINPSNMSRMLRGLQSVTDQSLRRISTAHAINYEWLRTGKGSMFATADVDTRAIRYDDRPRQGAVPYYDEDFMAGFALVGAEADGHESVSAYVTVPGFQRATLWCNVSGHSMEPEISSGDLVALQRVEDFSFLSFDSIYAIVTTNGMRTVKRLGQSADPQCYRLVPTNKSFPEQDLPKDKILHVYRVLGAVRSFG